MKYKVVEDAFLRYQTYMDGEAKSVGYKFFDKKAYESAKAWLTKRGIEFADEGFHEKECSDEDFVADVIVTSYTEESSLYVFEHLDEAEECRMCVIESRWVDVL